jgi:6-phosphofructokinase
MDLGPLPGVGYPIGTMAIADIYPTHVGIGGITTQDRALPAFADATADAAARSLTRTGLVESDLMGQPAGYLVLLLLALVALAWVLK